MEFGIEYLKLKKTLKESENAKLYQQYDTAWSRFNDMNMNLPKTGATAQQIDEWGSQKERLERARKEVEKASGGTEWVAQYESVRNKEKELTLSKARGQALVEILKKAETNKGLTKDEWVKANSLLEKVTVSDSTRQSLASSLETIRVNTPAILQNVPQGPSCLIKALNL
jgi:hypothetical protein